MRKANVILWAIVVFTMVAAGTAFKVSRFNSTPAYTYTSAYYAFGTAYTLGGAYFCATNSILFLTTGPGIISTVYRPTGISILPLTLTRVGGLVTLTIPAWSCTTTLTLVTYAQ